MNTVCPNCASTDCSFLRKSAQWKCCDCEHQWQAAANARPSQIFLSYGRDALVPLVLRIKQGLVALGHEVWFDGEKTRAGTDWEAHIEKGLDWAELHHRRQGSGWLIFVLTPHSARRPDGYCLNELAQALSRGLPILPVMLSPVRPPLSIARLQYIEATRTFTLGRSSATSTDETLVLHDEAIERCLQEIHAGLQAPQALRTDSPLANLAHHLLPLDFTAETKALLRDFTGRVWALDTVQHWLGDDTAATVFWVTGAPGAGKTCFAAWLGYQLPEVVAQHFCQATNPDKRNARRAVMSIAYQLATQLVDYAELLHGLAVADIVSRADGAASLFDQLLVQPLSHIGAAAQRRCLILIDGLDEATANGRNELAELLADHWKHMPPWMRLLITSRPEREVSGPLQRWSPWSLDAQAEQQHSDMQAYVSRRLQQPDLAGIAEGEKLATDIVAHSGGSFLYLSQVLDAIACHEIAPGTYDRLPAGLDGWYARAVPHRFGSDETRYARVRPLLRCIAAARQPLPVPVLRDALHYESEEFHRLLGQLGSMFPLHGAADEATIEPFHLSILDWLTNPTKAGDWWIDTRAGHCTLAEHGLVQYAANPSSLAPYVLKHLPAHLVALGDHHRAVAYLTDPDVVVQIYDYNVDRLAPEINKLLDECATHGIDIGAQMLSREMVLNDDDDVKSWDRVGALAGTLGDTHTWVTITERLWCAIEDDDRFSIGMRDLIANNYGAALGSSGRLAESETMLRKSLEFGLARASVSDLSLRLQILAELSIQTGCFTRACEYLRGAVSLGSAAGHGWRYYSQRASLAEALWFLLERDESLRHSEAAVLGYADVYGPNHPTTRAARRAHEAHLTIRERLAGWQQVALADIDKEVSVDISSEAAMDMLLAHNNYAIDGLRLSGQFAEGLHHVEKAQQYAARVSNREEAINLRVNRQLFLHLLGRATDAKEIEDAAAQFGLQDARFRKARWLLRQMADPETVVREVAEANYDLGRVYVSLAKIADATNAFDSAWAALGKQSHADEALAAAVQKAREVCAAIKTDAAGHVIGRAQHRAALAVLSIQAKLDANLLDDIGEYRKAAEMRERTHRSSPSAASAHNLAESYINMGLIPLARPLVQSALAGFRRTGSRVDLAKALGNAGRICRFDGDLVGALRNHDEEERLAQGYDDATVAESAWNQAIVHRWQGNHDIALGKLAATSQSLQSISPRWRLVLEQEAAFAALMSCSPSQPDEQLRVLERTSEALHDEFDLGCAFGRLYLCVGRARTLGAAARNAARNEIERLAATFEERCLGFLQPEVARARVSINP